MASPTRWTWVWVSSGSWWWTGKPGVLQFMVLQRVRHDWATELPDWTDSQINKYLLKTTRSVVRWSWRNLRKQTYRKRKITWRRKWQPTPIFLPREFHGQRSLVGCSLWGHKELDTTEWLTLSISRSSTPNSRHSREKTCFHTVSILKDSQSSQCKRLKIDPHWKPSFFKFQNWGQREDAKVPEQKTHTHTHTHTYTQYQKSE